MTVENVASADGTFGGRICDKCVIDERGRCFACTYVELDALVHAHRESWIPSRAATNPVAWHTFLSVRMVMIGQVHAATAANVILGVLFRLSSALSQAAEGELGRWVANRTRQLGFKKFATPASS